VNFLFAYNVIAQNTTVLNLPRMHASINKYDQILIKMKAAVIYHDKQQQ